MALGRSAPNAIRIADMAIAGDGLPWPVGPWRPWLSHQAVGSTLVHGKYLPSCRTRMFLTSSNFESKQAARVLMWSANSGTPRSSCICLLLMYQGAPAFRPGSLLTCHCLPSLFFRRTSSWMPDGIGGRASSRGRHLGLYAASVYRTAPEKFSSYVSIAIPLYNSGSKGIWSSKWVWKLAQSLLLKSGLLHGC